MRRHASDANKAQGYRRATFKLLLSDRIAFGQPILLDAVLLLIRIWLCWICARAHVAIAEAGDWKAIAVPGVPLGIAGVHVWRDLWEWV